MTDYADYVLHGAPTDRGDWMQTYMGGRFYPLDPRPQEIDSRDIAHALSLMCRYGGHVDRFYSVAEHCVLMAEYFMHHHNREYALAALLHDATEAYVVDVPRPLKRYLEAYQAIEASVWAAIAVKYEVSYRIPEAVKDADNRIILTEKAVLLSNSERWEVEDTLTPLPVTVEGWEPRRAAAGYLNMLERLT